MLEVISVLLQPEDNTYHCAIVVHRMRQIPPHYDDFASFLTIKWQKIIYNYYLYFKNSNN